MSQENMELVQRSFEAWSGDGFDGIKEFWHPEIDWRAAEGALDDRGPIKGHDGMRRYIDDWRESFDHYDVRPEELIDAGGDTVVAVQSVTGIARGSGPGVDMRYAVVYTVRDGLIVRAREYFTLEEALEAVGLSE